MKKETKMIEMKRKLKLKKSVKKNIIKGIIVLIGGIILTSLLKDASSSLINYRYNIILITIYSIITFTTLIGGGRKNEK